MHKLRIVKINNRIPTHLGEMSVYESLEAFCSDEITSWFSIDFLPGVSDLDLLLLDKKSGIFALEIKAIPLQEIIEISLNSIEIRGRGKKKSTNEQAYDALISLMNYSTEIGIKLPFMVASTVWPRITSSEWKSSFKNVNEIYALSDSMIFKDDLVSLNILRRKLIHIYQNPPIRKGSYHSYKYSKEHSTNLTDLLVQKASEPKLPTFSKFESVAKNQRKTVLKKYPLNKEIKVVFEGIPGSGKTYSLLTLAYLHGIEGRSVFLLCFNKVLAAQLRANILSLSEEVQDPELNDFIQVYDIYDHVSKYADLLDISGINSDDYEEWLDLIIEEIKSVSDRKIARPDVLLVDEIQDFSLAEIKWIKYWANHCKWVAFAKGIGQEVYLDEEVLNNLNWLSGYKKELLIENYRNPGKLFLLSKLISEAKLKKEHLSEATNRVSLSLKQKSLKINRHDEFGFETKLVDDSTTNKLIKGYKQLILNVYNSNLELGIEPYQNLIIVRGKQDKKLVLEALNELADDNVINYLNLTEKKFKRFSPSSDKVRICTYESSRGLEAHSVILFGFEQLVIGERKDSNLGFIALTRATSNTILVVKKERASLIPELFNTFTDSLLRLISVI